jgi:glutamyl-tRNA synthetase
MLNDEDFFAMAERFIKSEIPADINKNKMLALLKTRIAKLTELDEKMAFFLALPEYDKELFLNKKNKINELDTVKNVLVAAKEVLANVESYDNDTLFAALTPLTEKLGLKTGAIMWCIRIAVSGLSATPGGATEIMEVVGKKETLTRIEAALNKLA